MDPRRQYAASFLEESLGLSTDSVEPGAVPSEFVDSLTNALSGPERSASEEPAVEKAVLTVGDDVERSLLDSDGFVLRKERWPGGSRYAACLTHDVDNITWPLSHVLQRKDRFSLLTLILAIAGLRDAYDNTSFVVNLERRRNVRSSFYFLSSAYDLKPKARELASIKRQGWDVGLHGDFGTHDSEKAMSDAVARLKEMTGQNPSGVREHYLKFDFKSTWGIMDRAGFVYDTTVGNTDKIGFRIGLCNPFHPPGGDWKPLKLLEIPLGLMDATLWGYLKREEAEGTEDFVRMKSRVVEANGLLTLLWHPESARMKGGRIYPRLLDILLKDRCFIGSGLDVADWWLRRSSPLVKEGGVFKMDAAPAGLVLKFRAKNGETAKVTGGTVHAEGDAIVINATGGPLRVTTG